MSGEPVVVTRLDELQRFDGHPDTIPVRIPLGISSFGINAYGSREAGGVVIEEHDELGSGAGGHEELYLVVRGHAVFTIAGEEVDARAGTLVFLADPAIRRAAVARAADTTVLVVGGVPGQAFEPSPWEAWLEALPNYESGNYGAALETMRRAHAAHPDNPNVLYNLACVESLAGEHDAALEHLARALELDPRGREWSKGDPDLDAIRADPRFPGS